jgi:hypothetical protein
LYCKEHFSKDDQLKLKALSNKEIDDDELLYLWEEFSQLLIYEKSIFN